MGVSGFWLILAVGYFFADGGFAIVGPYAAEVWPVASANLGHGLGLRLWRVSARSSGRSVSP